MRKLFWLILIGLVLSCTTSEELFHDEGFTYRRETSSFVLIPYSSTITEVEISDEKFETVLARREAQMKQEHQASMQAFCRLIIYILVSIAVVAGLLAVFTKSVGSWGTVAIACVGMSFLVAAYSRALNWVATAWFIPIAFGLGVLFFIERRFSLFEWLLRKRGITPSSEQDNPEEAQ